MRFTDQTAARPDLIPRLNDLCLADEQTLVREFADTVDPGDNAREKIQGTAAQLVLGSD